MKNNSKKNNESILVRTRPLQIAALVILIALGSVMIFSRGGATSNGKLIASNTLVEKEDSQVLVLTDAEFKQTISEGVTLVDFWAVWCPPCRIQNPIIEQVAAEIGDVATIAKLDVDNNPLSPRSYSVQNIPTLIIFKNGEPVQRFVGVQQKETLLTAIRSHI
jgi:thioredoxin 1